MFVFDTISAVHFGDGELRIDFGNGDVDMYRIKDGQLEFFTERSPTPAWYLLTPEEILQHVVLGCCRYDPHHLAPNGNLEQSMGNSTSMVTC